MGICTSNSKRAAKRNENQDDQAKQIQTQIETKHVTELSKSRMISQNILQKQEITQSKPIEEEKQLQSENKNSIEQLPSLPKNQSKKQMKQFNYSSSDSIQLIRDKFSKYYTIVKVIGKGGYGQVFQVQHNITKQMRAVKLISQQFKKGEQPLLKEMRLLKTLDHPNIIRIYEIYKDDKYTYLVEDFCAGGELLQQLSQNGKYSQTEACKIIVQVLHAVAYLHERKIVHRDIKPENLLYTTKNEGQVLKLIDFGISNVVDEMDSDCETDKRGTLLYMAPEAIEGKLNIKSDIWACGVLLYFLLTGNHPFRTDKDIKQAILQGTLIFEKEWDQMIEAKKLILKMLAYRTKDRYTASQCLNHPWICKNISDQSEIKTETLTKIKEFKWETKLSCMLLMYAVNLLSQQEEKDYLSNQFKQMDLDKDGRLGQLDLINSLLRFDKQSEANASQVFLMLDLNHNGEIDYSEFLMACIDKSMLLSKENLSQIYRCIDKESKGWITVKDLKQSLDNGYLEDNLWKDLFSQLDQNNDGKVVQIKYNFQRSQGKNLIQLWICLLIEQKMKQ